MQTLSFVFESGSFPFINSTTGTNSTSISTSISTGMSRTTSVYSVTDISSGDLC